MKGRNLLIALILLGLVAWGVYDNKKAEPEPLSASDPASTAVTGVQVGNLAPDFTVAGLDGQNRKLSDYKGSKVLLNFWATWCPPCKAEMPHMEKFYEAYKNDGVVVLSVNLTHTEKAYADVEAFVRDYGMTFPVVLDAEGKVSSRYQVIAYPTSFFLDPDGVIRSKVPGTMDYERMKKLMRDVR